MKDEPEVCDVFMLVGELALARGVESIDQMPGAWECRVDKNWTVAVNAHRYEAVPVQPEFCMPVTLRPFETAIWWNGWLAGLMLPAGGWMAAHVTGASEGRLIEDLKAAIAKEGTA